MEFTLHGKGNSVALKDAAPKSLSIRHKLFNEEKELLFVIAKGPKLKMHGNDPRLYGYALGYLKGRKLEDKFFNIYVDAKEAGFVMVAESDEKLTQLKDLMGSALDELAITDITQYLLEHDDYENFISSAIKATINTVSISDGEGTVAQTYTRDDYIRLVAILIQQQLLLPIYTDFLTIGVGNTNPLEKPTSLEVLRIQESLGLTLRNPSVGRLLSYIKEHLISLSGGNQEKILNIAAHYRVTDDELPVYVLSHVLTRLLPIHQPICKVNGVDVYKDVATDIFSIIKNIMTESAVKTPNKINPQDAYNGEGKDSMFESNQATTNISQADEAMILVSVTANTDAELESMLVILFKEFGMNPTDEDFDRLHSHRLGTDGFYLEELNIWLIAIFSCVLLPSKFLDILDPDSLYNLNSIIYTLVYKLLGVHHSKLYCVKFRLLPETIVLSGADNISKDDLRALKEHYPIMIVNSKGVSKPVIALWITKLKNGISELGLTNPITNRPIKLKGIKDLLVDLLIVSVDKRIKKEK